MDKVFHVIAEIVYWTMLFLCPVLFAALVGAIIITTFDLSISVLYILVSVGIAVGVFFAEHIRRKHGCANYCSSLTGMNVNAPEDMSGYIISEILAVPRNFRHSGLSAYAMLQDTGYFKFYEDVTVARILHKLKHEPALVGQWIAWSEDKRSDGWYITERNGKYVVGHLGKQLQTEYRDKDVACANFIKLEIEAIRTI